MHRVCAVCSPLTLCVVLQPPRRSSRRERTCAARTSGASTTCWYVSDRTLRCFRCVGYGALEVARTERGPHWSAGTNTLSALASPSHFSQGLADFVPPGWHGEPHGMALLQSSAALAFRLACSVSPRISYRFMACAPECQSRKVKADNSRRSSPNPQLTFVTPTLLAGDRSLVDTIAHEVAHSWTGMTSVCFANAQR